MRRAHLMVAAFFVGLASRAGIAAAADRADVARGAYLVGIAACAGCHTPKGPTGAGPAFSGGRVFGGGPNPVASANLTPDSDTGIGAWPDEHVPC